MSCNKNQQSGNAVSNLQLNLFKKKIFIQKIYNNCCFIFLKEHLNYFKYPFWTLRLKIFLKCSCLQYIFQRNFMFWSQQSLQMFLIFWPFFVYIKKKKQNKTCNLYKLKCYVIKIFVQIWVDIWKNVKKVVMK